MWLPWLERMSIEKTVQYIFHFGDQHIKEPVNTISDGGSNIHIHLIREFLKRSFRVDISTYKDNFLYQNYFSKEKNVSLREFFTLSWLLQRCLVYYEIIWRCLFPGMFFLFRKTEARYLITQTDFLPDTVAALFAKIRNHRLVWVASYFLDAPKPWDPNTPYQGIRRVWGFFYWFWQRPSYWLIRLLADFVLVTSVPDVRKFITAKRSNDRVIVVRGGVDLRDSEDYLRSGEPVPVGERRYDACFVGRFHTQKGVLELVDIWSLVCQKHPSAKLALIGHGSLEEEIKEKIKVNNLGSNIDLYGYLFGQEKFEFFRQSKIVVHPAIYDSGGMAAAEAMAWGLPGVSFDLEALKTYYPKGMVKTPCFDLDKFAENILKLLDDKDYYAKMSKDARDLIVEEWDWDKRSREIIDRILDTK